MNYTFIKTSSPSSGFFAVAVFLLFSFAIIPLGELAAEESADNAVEGEEPDTIRYEESLPLRSDRAPVDFRIFQKPDQSRRVWQLTATSDDRPDETICRSTLPAAVGEDYYDFDLEHLAVNSNAHVVLLNIEARPDAGPLDPAIHQLAFHIVPRSGANRWSCNVIGRGDYNRLDGGPHLKLEEIDGVHQLTRHDVADRISFCGLRLEEDHGFETFEPESGRFIAATPLDISDDDAGTLQASLPEQILTSPLVDSFYSWLSASSDIRGAPSGASVPRPLALGDLDLSSAWREGAEGVGRGEFVTAGVNLAAPLRSIRIFPGHGESREQFKAYARPTQLLLGFSDGYRYIVDLPALSYEELIETGGLIIELPEPLMTRCLSVMILDAEPGDLSNSSVSDRQQIGHSVAISEITVYSTLDADTEAKTATNIVAELSREPSRERRDRIARLGQLIPDAMTTAIEEVLEDDNATARVRTLPLLGLLPHERALTILQDHFHRISSEDDDYRQTKRSIATHGSLAAPVLLEILDTIDDDERKYVDTVRLIGRVGSDIHFMRLIVDLGEGSDTLRRERIRAIANGGIGVIPRLLTVAEAEIDNASGLDALTTVVFVGQRHFSQQQAEFDQSEKLFSVYNKSENRAHRIRAIEALGYFHHSPAVELLGREILTQDRDPVIRQFAAAALQLYPGDKARNFLEDALSDASPDVRIAAIKTLNRRADSADSADTVIEYIETERWPRGLHHAMQLLATSPQPEALDAMATVVADDITSARTSMALRSLRRADKSLPVSQVRSHLRDQATPQPILEQLVQMLGFARPEEVDELLISIANRDHPPMTDRESNQLDALAGRALLALGNTDTDRSKNFLLSIVDDDTRSMRDRSYSLRALGFFSDPELLVELRDMAPRIPRELRDRFRQTLRIMQNRLAIDDAGKDLQHFIDRLDDGADEEVDKPIPEPRNPLPDW